MPSRQEIKKQINKDTIVIDSQIANCRVSGSLYIFLKSYLKNENPITKQRILNPPKRDKHRKKVAKESILYHLDFNITSVYHFILHL